MEKTLSDSSMRIGIPSAIGYSVWQALQRTVEPETVEGFSVRL